VGLLFLNIMNRIYHHYEKWEDFKAGFYDNITGNNKEKLILKVIELFNNPALTEKYMRKAINEWIYSCEHNLSNISLNRIAYIGQAACCLYASVPCTITMNAWNKIHISYRNVADSIAIKIIKEWEQNQKLKNILVNGAKKDIQMEYQTKCLFN
jgi:hypothetical protein